MTNLSSSDLYHLFQFQRVLESRDDLLDQVAERLNELYDLIKISYYGIKLQPKTKRGRGG